jgi:hypothetical protein
MKITLSAPSAVIGRQITRESPYSFDAIEAQVAVGLVMVNLFTPAFGTAIAGSYRIYLINRSLGGEIIRIGTFPSFAPARGLSLNVGDAQMYDNVWIVLNAIANGAGGLLDIQIMVQN